MAGTRTSRLVKPLSCIEHLRPKYKCLEDHMSIIEDERNISPDILVVGPRTEGELFLFYAYGFDLKNIEAIDLISYSPLISLETCIIWITHLTHLMLFNVVAASYIVRSTNST